MSGSSVHRRRAPPPAGAGRVRRLLQCVASPSGARPACAVRISSDGPVQPDGPDHRAAGARGPASCVSPCSLMVGWSCCALQPPVAGQILRRAVGHPGSMQDPGAADAGLAGRSRPGAVLLTRVRETASTGPQRNPEGPTPIAARHRLSVDAPRNANVLKGVRDRSYPGCGCCRRGNGTGHIREVHTSGACGLPPRPRQRYRPRA